MVRLSLQTLPVPLLSQIHIDLQKDDGDANNEDEDGVGGKDEQLIICVGGCGWAGVDQEGAKPIQLFVFSPTTLTPNTKHPNIEPKLGPHPKHSVEKSFLSPAAAAGGVARSCLPTQLSESPSWIRALYVQPPPPKPHWHNAAKTLSGKCSKLNLV